MTVTDPFAAIERLADEGALRVVYVLGVPRSNSTIVCRLIGEHLDGAVYEPALPNTGNPARHYAETILDAYDSAREHIGDGRPVALAIKDLDGFVTDRMFAFALDAAEHIVFTTRDPLMQHASLSRRFVDEFAPKHRFVTSLRHPVEEHHFLWNTVGLLPRFWRLTRNELGRGRQMLRAAVAGFNYLSWRAQASHLAAARRRLGSESVTIMDAALMRLDPDVTVAELAAIAESARDVPAEPAPAGLPGGGEHAGHTRMTTESHWAREALASNSIKPVGPDERFPLTGPAAVFARDVAATLYSQYAETVLDPLDRQLAALRAKSVGRDLPSGLKAVLDARDTADAAARLAAR